MKGFTYTVTAEQIKRHQQRSLLEKLQLIEEFIYFNDAFASEKAKALQKALRAGREIVQ